MLNNISFNIFKNRNFSLYLVGQFISLCGTWLQYVAMGWLIYQLTQSAFLLSAAGLAAGIPMLFMTPFSGLIIDRINKKKLFIVTQFIFFIDSISLGLLTIFHHLDYTIIIMMSFVGGLVFAFDYPLRQTLFPCLLKSKTDLSVAIAWNFLINNLSRILSPFFAGYLIFYWGEGICFLLNSLSFLFMLYIIYKIDWKITETEKKDISLFGSWKNGLCYVKSNPLISQTLLFSFFLSATLSTYTMLAPVIARVIYQGGVSMQGHLLTASGMGAVFASIAITQRKYRSSRKLIPLIVFSAVGALFFLQCLINFSNILWGILSILLLSVSLSTAALLLNTVLQQEVSENERGFVMSLFAMAYLGSSPFTNCIAGWLVDLCGIRVALTIFCVIFFLSLLHYFYRINRPIRRVLYRV